MSSPHGCLCVTVAVLGPVLLYNPNPLQADSDNIDSISSFYFFFLFLLGTQTGQRNKETDRGRLEKGGRIGGNKSSTLVSFVK